MKIWFGCSTSEFIKYKENYFAIRNFLVEDGHLLTRDWLKPTLDKIQEGQRKIGVEEIYTAVMKAINEADMVIIEDTVSNFSTGHQITVALQRNKPVLVLRAQPKRKFFDKSFLDGLKSPNLEIHEYNLKNYKEIIRAFIKKFENSNKKNRFHLVIDEVERKYLDWAQFQKGESRTTLIRKSLRKTINEDPKYQEYLKK